MAAAVMTMSSQHAAGIFANRNLDGPEIGTLVVVVDRAKNLPNLRTMGKQNPYCAARLGKMALKTETDHRGGQTPKWDQELRFTVHESNDYQRLKLSIFNEDKRTDLIGETFIDIDDVLRRGGGQKDSWHELQSKGKYAGQVRIELTFYDCRPREEQAQAHEQPALSVSTAREPAHQMAGPRELTPKRLQPDLAAHAEQALRPDRQQLAIPAPLQAPRSFHTPPRMTSTADLQSEEAQSQQQSKHQLSKQWTESLGAAHEQYPPDTEAQHEFNDLMQDQNDDFQYPDDPYALQAAHVEEQPATEPTYIPYRNDRVQQLSGTPKQVPHSYSASAAYPPNASYGGASRAFAADQTSDDVYNPVYHHTPSYDSTHFAAPPPPPPSHRTSLPAPRHQLLTQHTPDRPAPQHHSHSDPYHHYNTYQEPEYPDPSREHHNYAAPRRRSANPYEGGFDSSEQWNDWGDSPLQQQRHKQSWNVQDTTRPQPDMPASMVIPAHDQSPHHMSSGHGPMIVRPRAISPGAPSSKPAIRRKSLNPATTEQSVPFSPDSFNAYNPSVSATATHPSTMQHNPETMYSHQRTESSPSAFPRQEPTSVPVPEQEGPIRDAHGRIVDPSDHLPPSTHAPEPEKKGSDRHRATITATVKTRFGPREARSAQITPTRTSNYSSPGHSPSPLSLASTPRTAERSAVPSPSQQREAMAAAARQRLQSRNNAVGHPGGSPLAPTAPGALNQGILPGTRSTAYTQGPPPVPMKIPLDADDHEEYAANDSNTTLSQQMSRIDLGPSPLQSLEARYGGTGGQRTRRSRFGA